MGNSRNGKIATVVLTSVMATLLAAAIYGGWTLNNSVGGMETKIDGLTKAVEAISKRRETDIANLREHELLFVHRGAEEILRRMQVQLDKLQDRVNGLERRSTALNGSP